MRGLRFLAAFSACLMAAFKSFAQWFPLERQASLTGWIMTSGTLGALVASAPLDAEMLPEAERGAGKVDDVRKLTEQVAWFITPQPDQADPDRYLPPAVSFAWGTFLFNGIVESIEENLEFFSPEGKPLRASLLLKLIQPRITAYRYGQSGAGNTAGASVLGGAPGTRPLTGATEGASLQAMAAAAGRADDWRAIASANGVEDPLRMQTGQMLDMQVGSRTRGG